MSDKQKTLEDLVPPLELCKAAREVIGERTALVWAHTGRDYEVTSREVWEIIEVCFDAIPAPTLSELLGMLPDGTTLKKDDVSVWISWKLNTVRDQNPAAAALRLLMRVKGAAV